jgi:N-acetylneuraminate synthase/N,N'-diacetyllegionaminate synthase
MKIGSFDLNKKVMVVAEIGNNHEGNLTLAKKMINLAAEAGADAVKFQTIIPEKLVSPDQTERIRQLRKFQFSYEQFAELKIIADREGVIFLSTPFDLESAFFLDGIVPAFKIASGDITFYQLLDTVAATGKPVILSTGASTLDEVVSAKQRIESVWSAMDVHQELAVLHCVVSYPTALQDVNLKCLQTLAGLGATAGYSDHTMGIEAPVLSVALGARIIEKHFTIDKKYSDFRDHSLSADPADFQEMVRRIREAEVVMGNGDKCPRTCEAESMKAVRRSAFSIDSFAKGHRLGRNDILWARPGTGIPPISEDRIVGGVLKRDLKKGEPILFSDLEEDQ